MGQVVRIEEYRRARELRRQQFNPWGLLLYTPFAFWALVMLELSK